MSLKDQKIFNKIEKIHAIKRGLRIAVYPFILFLIFMFFALFKPSPSSWFSTTATVESIDYWEHKRSKTLDIYTTDGEFYRITDDPDATFLQMRMNFKSGTKLNITYHSWLGVKYVNALSCNGDHYIRINSSINQYYSDLKALYIIGGVFGLSAIIVAFIPLILLKRKVLQSKN